MANAPGDRAAAGSQDIIKSQVDLGAGLFLLLLAAIGYWGALGLRFGTLNSVGPAFMPRSVSVLIALFGLGLVITGFLSKGPRLEKWHYRAPFFVLGAIVIFALTIRGSTLSMLGVQFHIPQLGLIIAGPLAVIVSAQADKDTKQGELLIYTAVLTLACIALFRFMLRLPIPIFPIGYELF